MNAERDPAPSDNLAAAKPGLAGKLFYHLLPVRRRVVLSNLERVFGEKLSRAEIVRLAQASYGHFARLLAENVWLPRLPAGRRAARLRCDNMEAFRAAASRGKGVLLLTGHFGNWEVAPLLWVERFPEYRGRLCVLRRPIRLRWLDGLLTRRFLRAGYKLIPKTGSLPSIIARLRAGDAVVFTLDQHSGRKEGVETEFFGHPACTFRGLAVTALRTGAPVLPLHFWREAGGVQVVRFEEALAPLEGATFSESVRANTQAYNHELERLVLQHPEQWFWMHRRWKKPRGRDAAEGGDAAAPRLRARPGPA